jgi:hypothetical protein
MAKKPPTISENVISKIPSVTALFFLKKLKFLFQKNSPINITAKSWYSPILKEVKLNNGKEKDGYLESGAKTISAINK